MGVNKICLLNLLEQNTILFSPTKKNFFIRHALSSPVEYSVHPLMPALSNENQTFGIYKLMCITTLWVDIPGHYITLQSTYYLFPTVRTKWGHTKHFCQMWYYYKFHKLWILLSILIPANPQSLFLLPSSWIPILSFD